MKAKVVTGVGVALLLAVAGLMLLNIGNDVSETIELEDMTDADADVSASIAEQQRTQAAVSIAEKKAIAVVQAIAAAAKNANSHATLSEAMLGKEVNQLKVRTHKSQLKARQLKAFDQILAQKAKMSSDALQHERQLFLQQKKFTALMNSKFTAAIKALRREKMHGAQLGKQYALSQTRIKTLKTQLKASRGHEQKFLNAQGLQTLQLNQLKAHDHKVGGYAKHLERIAKRRSDRITSLLAEVKNIKAAALSAASKAAVATAHAAAIAEEKARSAVKAKYQRQLSKAKASFQKQTSQQSQHEKTSTASVTALQFQLRLARKKVKALSKVAAAALENAAAEARLKSHVEAEEKRVLHMPPLAKMISVPTHTVASKPVPMEQMLATETSNSKSHAEMEKYLRKMAKKVFSPTSEAENSDDQLELPVFPEEVSTEGAAEGGAKHWPQQSHLWWEAE